MPKLHELKHARALKAAQVKTLIRKEEGMPEDQSLGKEDVDALEELRSAIDALDARIARVEQAQADEADDATELDADGEGGDPEDPETRDAGMGGGAPDDDQERSLARRQTRGHRTYATPMQHGRKGFRAAQFLIGCGRAKTAGFRGAADWAKKRFGDETVAKALNSAANATGGALIPQAFANEIIELLRATTVVRGSSPMSVSMPGGNLTMPRLAAGATAGYQGELDDINVSQETFDDVQLNAKKLTAMVPVSNDLIRRAPVNVEEIVRDDLIQTLARREDLAFLVGDGSQGTPIGLLNLCSASQSMVAAAFSANANQLDVVSGVLTGMRLTLENNMSRMLRPVWFTSPAVKFFLMSLRDGVGEFYFKEELQKPEPTLWGIPFKTTQQIPTNLNTGTSAAPVNNGTYLFLVDMADIILADTYNILVDASDVANYADSNGNQVSAFRRDQTVFRVISEHDLNTRHQASIAVAILPGWAPPNFTPEGGQSFFVQAPSGIGSAAPSTWGTTPTGSNVPGNNATVAPGGTEPGIA